MDMYNNSEHLFFTRNFETSWDVIAYLVHFLRHQTFLKIYPQYQINERSIPPFIFSFCEIYLFPLYQQLSDFHDAVACYKTCTSNTNKSMALLDTVKKQKDNNHVHNLPANLPVDVWSCIMPHLKVTDWYHLCQTSSKIRSKISDSDLLSSVSFKEVKDLDRNVYESTDNYRINVNQSIYCSIWHNDECGMQCTSVFYSEFADFAYSPHTRLRVYHSNLINFEWFESPNQPQAHVGSLELKRTPEHLYGTGEGQYALDYFWSYYNYYHTCNYQRYLGIARPGALPRPSLFFSKLTPYVVINMNEYCSAFTIRFPSQTLDKYRAIRKRHTENCACHLKNNSSTTNNSNTVCDDITFPIGSQATDLFVDGVEVIDANESLDLPEKWTYISFNKLKYESITNLPWFWPWYYNNNILLLASFQFRHSPSHLNIHVVIARRKIYNYKYHFELVFL